MVLLVQVPDGAGLPPVAVSIPVTASKLTPCSTVAPLGEHAPGRHDEVL